MKLKLNEKAVAKLRAPDPSGKQTPYWDTDLKGFAVLCSGVTNQRTYVVQRDVNGKSRRVTIGAVNEITLSEARQRAADMLDDLRRGKDPKQRSSPGRTLVEVFHDYLAARKTMAKDSVKTYRANFKNLKSWHDLPLADISGDMVEKRHTAIAAEVEARGRNRGKYTANATLRLLRTLYEWAAERQPGLPPNPVRFLKRAWYPEGRRIRRVADDELPRFYNAVCALDNKVARDYILFMLFTGMRMTEAGTLRWSDVDLANRAITSAKLPLTDFVRDMLVARRALGDTHWVFLGNSKDGHIGDPDPWLTRVAEGCGVRVSAHDLRRTYSTIAEGCASYLELKQLLGHSVSSDVTAGYVVMAIERLREPAQKVCDKLKALCEIEEPAGANVTRMAVG